MIPLGKKTRTCKLNHQVDKPAANGGGAASPKKDDACAEIDWPVDAELFGVAEIAEMATLLLQMILELCGESESIFCSSA